MNAIGMCWRRSPLSNGLMGISMLPQPEYYGPMFPEWRTGRALYGEFLPCCAAERLNLNQHYDVEKYSFVQSREQLIEVYMCVVHIQCNLFVVCLAC